MQASCRRLLAKLALATIVQSTTDLTTVLRSRQPCAESLEENLVSNLRCRMATSGVFSGAEESELLLTPVLHIVEA